MTIRAIAALLLAALLAGCSKPQTHAAIFYGALAVAAPPLIAYKKIDDVLALGPAPRQAWSHPLTGVRLASRTVKDQVLDVAWRDTNRLAILTKTSFELWETGGPPRTEGVSSIIDGHVLRLDPAAYAVVNWDTVNRRTSWQTFDGNGFTDLSDLTTACANAEFADDGSGFVCAGTREVAFYAVGSPNPIWGFERLPEEPKTCSPEQPCHPFVFAAAAGKIASAQMQLTFAQDVTAGPISLHSRAGASRTLTPVVAGGIRQLRFSPDGTLLMVTTARTTHDEVHVIDTVKGTELIAIPNASWSPSFKISRDSRFICGPTRNHSLLLIDLEKKQSEEFATGQKYGFTACAFSPDGTRLAMAVSSFLGPNPVVVYELNPR